MAVGEAVRRRTWDVDALRSAEDRLERRAVDAGRIHAALLRDVLVIHREHVAAGLELSTEPRLTLLLRCSSWRAGRLLDAALLLSSLPEGLAALEWGLLTVEQSAVVATQLPPLEAHVRLIVWQRLLTRLRADVEACAVLPPARLTELLKRWVLEAVPREVEQRRKDGAEARRVSWRRREDGLSDVTLFGVPSPLAQTVLQRIRAGSQPVSLFDDRTADQRRLDAAVDLLLGRADHVCDATCPPTCAGARGCRAGAGSAGAGGCGCRPGTAVPCGAQVVVHVPLGAALGTTDEVADLIGHGPLEPDVLCELLLNAPRLMAVHVDADGVPVALAEHAVTVPRADPAALRAALLGLAGRPPAQWQPRHTDDHAADERPPTTPRAVPAGEAVGAGVESPEEHLSGARPRDEPPPLSSRPPLRTPPRGRPLVPPRLADPWPSRPYPTGEAAARMASHPPGTAGPYRPPRRMRRLVFLRAPRCEFPGCGESAERCDAEHDLAWPAGPTCPCNLGPCCRRHHRVKQQGWTKQRGPQSAVVWTSPTGRAWTGRGQHQPPARPVRPLTTLPAPRRGGGSRSADDELSPFQLDDELYWLTEGAEDPTAVAHGAVDLDPDLTPETADDVARRLSGGGTRWTLDLDDPYAWLEELTTC